MIQKSYKKRLQFQITVYFILLAILAINSVGWFLYFRTKHYFDVELGKKLVGVSQSSADFMDADLLTYLKPGDENGSFYKSLLFILNILKKDFQVNRIYILDKDFRVLVDTQANSSIASTIPHLQSNLVELNSALNGNPAFSTLYRGQNGDLYKSAFSSIKDKSGSVVALTGVDASPAFLQVIDKIRNSIILINLISLAFALFTAIILARSIVNPVKKLVHAAQRIRLGDFSQPVKITLQNEIGFLGHVFNDMQKSIKSNEEKLDKLRHLAEAEAASIKNYNDYILQSIANGILTLDSQGKIIVINPEAARILNVTSEKCVGKYYSDVFPNDHPLNRLFTEKYRNTQKPTFIEEIFSFNASLITVGIQVSPLRDSEKHIIGTNLVFADLTELRELQEKIKAKERMAYLGELSAAVAHEIRNPLNSIELYIGLIKRKVVESGSLHAIEKIQQEIRALNNIVSHFLIFARPVKLDYQFVVLSELFQEALMLAEDEIQKQNTSVQIDLPENKLELMGDMNQLKQALLNIILNSIQAMPQHGKLNISASQFVKPLKVLWLRIEVRDCGNGIPEELVEQIFEPFFSTRSQGTGLGLAIVRNIIHAHGGVVFVNRTTDQGTTMTIELPKEMKI